MCRLKTAILVLLIVVVACLSCHKRRGNGDVFAYCCEILRMERNPRSLEDFQRFHAELMAEVKAWCTPAQWHDLTQGSPKRVLGSSPETGPQNLMSIWDKRKLGPRIVYRYSCWLVWRLGVPLGLACYVVSGICAGLCLIPIYLIVGGGWRGLATAGICAIGWRIDLAGATASPDSMAALGALWAVYLRDRQFCAILLPVLVLIRPDLVILVGLIVWLIPLPLRWRLAVLATTAALYAMIGHVYACPPWSEWFYRDLVTPFYRLAPIPFDEPTPGVLWSTYRDILLRRSPLLYRGLWAHMFWVVAALGLIRVDRRSWPLLALPVAYVLAHFALFPFFFHRFFLWCFVLATCAVVGYRPRTQANSC